MKELTESFDKGRIPSALEITGSWVAIGLFGDFTSFNCSGVTRGPKFEWVLRVNQYSVDMDILGTHPQKTTLKSDNGGSLALPVDFEGDSMPIYKCRLTQRRTLACIFHGPGGTAGVEFKKVLLKQ